MDLLLGHGGISPEKRVVRNAGVGNAPENRAGIPAQQYGQIRELQLRQLRGRAGNDTLFRIGEVLPHGDLHPVHAPFGNGPAYILGLGLSAGEKEGLGVALHLASRIEYTSVGAGHMGVLPGCLQLGA